MLAHRLIPSPYDFSIVLISLLVAIVGSSGPRLGLVAAATGVDCCYREEVFFADQHYRHALYAMKGDATSSGTT